MHCSPTSSSSTSLRNGYWRDTFLKADPSALKDFDLASRNEHGSFGIRSGGIKAAVCSHVPGRRCQDQGLFLSEYDTRAFKIHRLPNSDIIE